MNDKKIAIISTVSGRITVSLPDIRFNREWARANAKVMVDKDTLEEMMFDQGVRYMFDTGMLYIEDLEIKKEIGLEPEDATAPVNIIILTDEQKKRALTHMPDFEFSKLLETMSTEQKQELVSYAVDNNIIPSIAKIDKLKETVNVDLLSAISLKRSQEVK